mgnify:CR=1 FL=1
MNRAFQGHQEPAVASLIQVIAGSDYDLVNTAQRGDQQSLVTLYERYYDRVYRFALSRLGSVADAEDLTQDTFLKMVDKLSSFSWKGSPFSAWLFRIAHNGVVDTVRRRSRRGLQVPMEAAQVAVAASYEGGMDDTLLLNDLVNAMGRLTQAQQEVLSLRFGAELSVSEAAQALGKAEGTVKATQFQALQALRKILAAERSLQ